MFKLKEEVREVGKGKSKIEEGDLVKINYLKALLKAPEKEKAPPPSSKPAKSGCGKQKKAPEKEKAPPPSSKPAKSGCGKQKKAMRALRYTDIEIMVGIPNEMLATLASSPKAAEKWVSKNVTAHLPGSGANIRLGWALTI
ncbi:hypothetical protein AgCh_004912 [Apium graveolens]